MLVYHQHGGSGMTLSYSDFHEMDITEIFWFLNRLNRMREHEADQLSKIK